jgi:hypothetical protein
VSFDFVAAYTALVVGIAVIVAPVALLGVVFLWRLHGEDRRQDERIPKPLLRLSFVLALTSTLSLVSCISLLALVAILPSELPQARITLVVLVEVLPVINGGYLFWLRRSRFRGIGKRRPPPWSSDD